MSASVIPSLKYSCAGSPVRLASGSTASERMRAWSGASAFRHSTGLNEISSASNAVAASAPASHIVRPRPGPVRGVVSGARGSGVSAAALGSTAWTSARNRYPRLGRVSTKRGDVAESPSAWRILLTATFSAVSNSTNVSSDHSARRSSSRVTTSPGRLTRSAKTWAGWSWRGTRWPARRSSPVARSSSKVPNRDDRRHPFRRRGAPDVRDEAVSARRHRLQVAWLGRRVAQRLAQLRDHARHRALADRRVLPHGVQQLLFPDHPARVLDQVGQQVDGFGLERYRLPRLRTRKASGSTRTSSNS